MAKQRIRILPDGPYEVSGGVPLSELIIVEENGLVHYRPGRRFETRETYLLCRCGRTKTPPFCDGGHVHGFDGRETASRRPVNQRALLYKGRAATVTDVPELCAFARFCHTAMGDVWSLVDSDRPGAREAAVRAACDCPAGRLVAWDGEGNPIEPAYEPSIVLLQDPSRGCSGPLWVRGGIPIISADGTAYEIRNRVTLCRCGQSGSMPFCDAGHVTTDYDDGFLRRPGP